MDVRAIVLVGRGSEIRSSLPPESIAGVPMAYLDVLGLPVLERVLRRLQHFGVTRSAVISDSVTAEESFVRRVALERPDVQRLHASGEKVWQVAESVFQKYSEDRAELVITLRIGPYVEVDYEEMVQHHFDKRCAVTQAADDKREKLDLFVLNASARKDAAHLFRSRFSGLRRACEPFPVRGYVNWLRNGSELRALAVDSLMEKNSLRPEGREVKPGVWVREPARIHPKARIVAPAFIGAHAKIRASALITRGTAVEHHAEVDCGTVVENSTVLPFTCVGAGLDVMHCVVGFRRLIHLLRNAEVEICDEKLVRMRAFKPVSRLAGSTAALFAFIPKQIYRGFIAPSHRTSAVEIPDLEKADKILQKPAMEDDQDIGPEASEFPSPVAVARKYGEK